MLLSKSRLLLIGNLWLATVFVIFSVSLAEGAQLSTSALLLAMGVTPFIVIRMIGFRPPPATIAQVLYDADRTDDRKR